MDITLQTLKEHQARSEFCAEAVLPGPIIRAILELAITAKTCFKDFTIGSVIKTRINHEQEPHCCGCWNIQYTDTGLTAECNECEEARDLVRWLSAPSQEADLPAKAAEDDGGYARARYVAEATAAGAEPNPNYPISSPSESAEGAPPFSNCSFHNCDLPGQCIDEGKCHHPKQPTESAAAQDIKDGLTPKEAEAARAMLAAPHAGLINRAQKFLHQLAPHIAERESAIIIRDLVGCISNLVITADDANLSCIAAEEERELLRKNNLANCLQITALQEASLKAADALSQQIQVSEEEIERIWDTNSSAGIVEGMHIEYMNKQDFTTSIREALAKERG